MKTSKAVSIQEPSGADLRPAIATGQPAPPPQKLARERLRTLTASIRRASAHPGDADSIHRLRVSIRRFSQALRVFDGCFSHSRKMRRRLRGLMDLCGATRDCDVAAEVLATAGVPADASFEKRLKQRRNRAGRKLTALLAEWDSYAGMRHWREWLTDKKAGQPAAEAGPLLTADFMRAGRAAAKTDAAFEQMHKFRLMVKKLRYTLEILSPDSTEIETLRGLQEHLGAINDCAITAELVEDLDLGAVHRRKIKAAVKRLLAQRVAEFRLYWRTKFQHPEKELETK
jgi:CHAD domain-containing protein